MAGRTQGFNPQPNVLKVRQDDYDIQRQSEPLVDGLNRLSDNPLLKSLPQEGVEFVIPSGTTTTLNDRAVCVRHQLGREYRGWTITCVDRPDIKVYEETSNARKSTELLLKIRVDAAVPAEESVKINLLVF